MLKDEDETKDFDIYFESFTLTEPNYWQFVKYIIYVYKK